jgi:hypothetical protein
MSKVTVVDLPKAEQLSSSEMGKVTGGESNAPDPISFILNAAAMDKGAYGVISAASQIEPSQGAGSSPNQVCTLPQ